MKKLSYAFFFICGILSLTGLVQDGKKYLLFIAAVYGVLGVLCYEWHREKEKLKND